MIPKIIHYNWFGGKPQTQLVEKCVQSWREYLPDYEIICWNEDNFKLEDHCIYVREAYRQGNFAFVSDYVQAWALHEYGGVYIDSDVEVRKNLDHFLQHRAFIGFQETEFPFTALWGCEKGHEFAFLLRKEYEQFEKFAPVINTIMVTRLLVDHFKVNPDEDIFQELPHGLMLYPSHYFCVDMRYYDDFNHHYACHHFNSSWIDKDNKPAPNFYKEFVFKKYMLRTIAKTGNIEITLNNVVNNVDNDLLLTRIGNKKILSHLIKSLFGLNPKAGGI